MQEDPVKATINATEIVDKMIGKLEGAGAYAMEKGSEAVIYMGYAELAWAGMWLIAALALLTASTVIYPKIPYKEWYESETGTAVAAWVMRAVAFLMFLGGVGSGLANSIPMINAPEGWIIVKAITGVT